MKNGSNPAFACVATDVGICYDLSLSRPRTLKQTARAFMRGHVRAATQQPFWAIRNISLSVEHGESIGIIGRNGSGKSTLLLALAGVLPVDEGSIVTHGAPTLLTLGAGFDSELTGRQNIYLSGAFLGFSTREVDELIDGIIEFSELGDFIDATFKQYSAGMRARLGFAIVSHIRSDILLLDEVFSVGDPSFQAKSQARMNELMNRASSMIIVSHDPGYLSRTCSRVAWLDRGTLVEFGEAEAVLSRYREAAEEPQTAPLRAIQ